MARKNAKLILDPMSTVRTYVGKQRCATVKIKASPANGYSNDIEIGKICELGNGRFSQSGPSPASHQFGSFKRRSGAIKGLVKSYKAWLG